LQHVLEATRFSSGSEPHVLDLVVTYENFVDSLKVMSPLGKSDHCVLTVDCELFQLKFTDLNKFNYNRGEYDSFKSFLNRDWEKELNGFNEVDGICGSI